MEEDMRKALLNKKLGTFDKQYEQGLLIIQRIKQKNDFMQRQVGTDVQDTIKKEIAKQKQFFQKQIQQLKQLIEDMEKKYKDPEAKNKMKNLKLEAQKQIERNKKILEEYINKSFLRISRGSIETEEDLDRYMDGGKVNYNNLDIQPKRKASTVRRGRQQENYQQTKPKAESLLTDDYLGVDFQIERKMLQQKKALLNQVEQATVRVNAIMSDMAILVDEQGENLYMISEQMMKANRNLVETNRELDEANKHQKKSRRKYIVCALLIILLVLGVVGVIFLGSF